MLSLVLTVLILYSCFLNNGSCDLYDELKEVKTEFDIKLYQRLAESENRTNLIVAPASVSISLGLLQFGAQGNTFTQLENALEYNIHDQRVQDFLHTRYEEVINSSQGPVVQLACALFVQAGIHMSPDFIEHTARWANSSLWKTNFSEPNRTAAQITEWITSNTGGGEANSICLDTVASPLNQVAVVSTMYFKSLWQKKFSFTDTQSLPFTTAEGFTLKVPTMYHMAEVNYGLSSVLAEVNGKTPADFSGNRLGLLLRDGMLSRTLDFFPSQSEKWGSLHLESHLKTTEGIVDILTSHPWKSVINSAAPPARYIAKATLGQFHTASLEQLSVTELPYLGATVSMFVVLPSDRTSLSQIESHLSAKIITVWANSLKRMKMDIFLPRFRIQSHLDLKMVLAALGITDMFDPTEADFKGISDQGSLYISEAIHKAKIEVTEEGTKASGATAMVLLKRTRTPIFKADRPFIFFLRHANTGSVLFIGRVTNPTE